MNLMFSTALAALGCVLALIWLAQLAVRRMSVAIYTQKRQLQPSPTRLLDIIETLRIDAQRHLHLVRCGNQQVLLLTGATQEQVVGSVDRIAEGRIHEFQVANNSAAAAS